MTLEKSDMENTKHQIEAQPKSIHIENPESHRVDLSKSEEIKAFKDTLYPEMREAIKKNEIVIGGDGYNGKHLMKALYEREMKLHPKFIYKLSDPEAQQLADFKILLQSCAHDPLASMITFPGVTIGYTRLGERLLRRESRKLRRLLHDTKRFYIWRLAHGVPDGDPRYTAQYSDGLMNRKDIYNHYKDKRVSV